MGSTTRDYAGDDDLRRMQALVGARWRRLGPLAATHVGDLAWWMHQHPAGRSEARIRLWLEDGEVVAFGWLWPRRGELDFAVHHERPELAAQVLAWARAERTWALDADEATVDAIVGAGYERDDGRWYEHHVRALDRTIERPRLPPGYRIRTLRGEADLDERVSVHRAAFHPSGVVSESYARLMRAWPYRPDLDHVVEARDGSFAAFCLAWLDEDNRAGLLEPVGTHPDHRRRGLASAVCLAALAALRDRGARHAVVLSAGGSDATGLYEKIGMPAVARHVAFRRRAGKGTVESGV